jgi:hypothetical protein
MFEPLLDPVPAPGAWLARRRQAAGLTCSEVAARLAALPWAIAPASPDTVSKLAERLADAETTGAPFTQPQAALLRNIFRFDLDIYFQLVDLAAAGDGCGLPVPQICTSCGCSWHDACAPSPRTGGQPCAWSDEDPHTCTACVRTRPRPVAAEPELVS